MVWSNPVVGPRVDGGEYGAPRPPDRHTGQDISCPIGTPVRAARSGRVVATKWGGGLGGRTGNGIVLEHTADGIWTYYGHLNGYGVSVGQQVFTGQMIAPSGNTGNSFGPHLHFEVITSLSNQSTVDPVPFMQARGVTLGVTPPVEDDLPFTETQLQQIFANGFAQALTGNQSRTAIRQVVWTDTRVQRGSVSVGAIQELADTKTASQEANSKADGILEGVNG